MEGTAQRVEDLRESQDDASGPDDEKKNQRQGPVIAVDGFAFTLVANEAREQKPRTPGQTIKDAGDAKPADSAPRQDDGLKGIEQHDQQTKNPADQRERLHLKSLLRVLA